MTDLDTLKAAQDQPPGSNPGGASVRSYFTGLGFAVVLTLGSFWVAQSNSIWAPGIPILLAVLAIAQMGVHLVFFLHISSAPEDLNNVLALAFGVFVVGLIVFGSLVIVTNLNENMMPMEKIIQMQR